MRRDLVSHLQNYNELNIPESEIEILANTLYIKAFFAGANELPRAKRTSQKQAEKELDALANQASKMIDLISKTGRTALAAIEAQQGVPHPLMVLDDLLILKAACEAATPTNDTGLRGRPIKHRANMTAKEARKIYQKLTGKTPTKTVDPTKLGNPASGEFLNFLQGILNICRIEASKESLFNSTK